MATPAALPFGPYRALAPLAEGLDDEAWLALAPPDTLCVLKLLREDRLADEAMVARFRAHAERWRSLVHPNLVRTLQAGDVDGEPYLAQELIEGQDLATVARRLREGGEALRVETAVHVVGQVVAALEHLQGTADPGGDGGPAAALRPSQVRVTYDGQVKLLDGGLARTVVGYRVDDLGALGVLLWELLAGQPIGARLDEGGTVVLAEGPRETIIERLLVTPAPPPSLFRPGLPPEVDELALAALPGRGAGRLTSLGALARAMAPFAGDLDAARAALAALMAATFAADEERAERRALLEAARGELPSAEVVTAPVTGRNEEPAAAAAPVRPPAPASPAPADLATAPARSRDRAPLIALVVGAAAAVAAVALALQPVRPAAPRLAAPSQPEPPPVVAVPALPQPQAAPAPPAAAVVPAPVPELPPALAEPTWPAAPAAAHRAVAVASGRKVIPHATRRAPGPAPELAPAPAPGQASSDAERLVYLEEARAAFARGELADALAAAKKATGGDERAHALLGAIYFKLGRYQEAEEEYAVALEKAPGDQRIARRLEQVRKLNNPSVQPPPQAVPAGGADPSPGTPLDPLP